MSEYPIEGLMNTAMNSIKEMIDVNTIIGEPIETSNNVVVIPVSKVNVGFAAGGSEFNGKTKKNVKDNKAEKENENADIRMPFGGGSGAGIGICPIAFIVIQETGVKLLPVEHSSSVDKLLDLMPDFADKIKGIIDTHFGKQHKTEEIKVKVDENNDPIEYEYDETSDM